eukprot:3011622-Rhodomonas_salina.1
MPSPGGRLERCVGPDARTAGDSDEGNGGRFMLSYIQSEFDGQLPDDVRVAPSSLPPSGGGLSGGLGVHRSVLFLSFLFPSILCGVCWSVCSEGTRRSGESCECGQVSGRGLWMGCRGECVRRGGSTKPSTPGTSRTRPRTARSLLAPMLSL